MAEWCLKCWNKDREPDEPEMTEDIVVLSDCLDLCEGCGEYKHVIVGVKNK